MQGFIFIFGVIFQIIVLMQINLKLRIGYNLFTNKGKVKFKLLGITFISSEFSIEKGYIFVKKKNGKIKLLPIDIRKPNSFDYVDFATVLIRKIYLKRVNIYANFGSKQSAFATSLVTGFTNSLSNGITAFIASKKQGVIVTNKTYGIYNKDYFKINLKASASLSLFDAFWSIGEYHSTKNKE